MEQRKADPFAPDSVSTEKWCIPVYIFVNYGNNNTLVSGSRKRTKSNARTQTPE